jgi:hypothetical protein
MGELNLEGLVADFALGMEKADAKRPQQISTRSGKAYQPGLGPHTEARTIDLVMAELETTRPDVYGEHATGVPCPGVSPIKRRDLVVGGWAVEAKMLRIMGDNGKPNDNMLMHILSPYPQHRSADLAAHIRGENVCHGTYGVFQRLMLPDPEHAPTSGPQSLVYTPVPINIPLELRFPVLRVDRRLSPMDWTAMPEATIDKDRQKSLRKHDIGLHQHFAGPDREVLAKTVAEAVEFGPKLRFWP